MGKDGCGRRKGTSVQYWAVRETAAAIENERLCGAVDGYILNKKNTDINKKIIITISQKTSCLETSREHTTIVGLKARKTGCVITLPRVQ